MTENAHESQSTGELRTMMLAVGKMADEHSYSRQTVVAIYIAINVAAMIALIMYGGGYRIQSCFFAVDPAFQLFVYIFVRMNQMRRLNLFRNNCVFLLCAFYRLLFKRRR